jgi:hypothetical protein
MRSRNFYHFPNHSERRAARDNFQSRPPLPVSLDAKQLGKFRANKELRVIEPISAPNADDWPGSRMDH